VTIHTADCPNVIELSTERLVDVQWDASYEQVYNAKIEGLRK
jgi:(p)ppGpp synthase/HD superfamily hydrolase